MKTDHFSLPKNFFLELQIITTLELHIIVKHIIAKTQAKTQTVTLTLISLMIFSSIAHSQEVSRSDKPDNQCRIQAKEIALKTYQTCVTDSRSARIDQIRKEYLEKLTALKNEYELQIKNLKTTDGKSATSLAPATIIPTSKVEQSGVVTEPSSSISTSKQIELSAPNQTTDQNQTIDQTDQTTETSSSVPEFSSQPTTIKNDPVEQQDLSVSLRPVNSKSVQDKSLKSAQEKSSKKMTKKSSAPVVAQKRAKGEKGIKGVAKTLPPKKRIVETKPASNVITESELSKTASIQISELETNEIAKSSPIESNEVTGETEKLQMVDPSLGQAQAAENQSTQQ